MVQELFIAFIELGRNSLFCKCVCIKDRGQRETRNEGKTNDINVYARGVNLQKQLILTSLLNAIREQNVTICVRLLSWAAMFSSTIVFPTFQCRYALLSPVVFNKL